MSEPRLRQRVESASKVSVAILAGFILAFHKPSQKDGSAKCDICPKEGSSVYGVVFEIDTNDLDALDMCEGNGKGYKRIKLPVTLDSGAVIHAETYKATAIDRNLKPYTWYLRHVVEGARNAPLPEEYIAALESVEAVRDPDENREKGELEIYS